MDLTVKYDKEMIDLVKEIRRHVDADLKPSIKLANPDLLYALRDIYLSGNDIVVNALIKEIYVKAGPDWILEQPKEPEEDKQLTVKVYRGHRQLIESAPQESEMVPKDSSSEPKKVRMYRGHPIVE